MMRLQAIEQPHLSHGTGTRVPAHKRCCSCCPVPSTVRRHNYSSCSPLHPQCRHRLLHQLPQKARVSQSARVGRRLVVRDWGGRGGGRERGQGLQAKVRVWAWGWMQGLWFRFMGYGLGFRVWGLGFGVWGLGFRVYLLGEGGAHLGRRRRAVRPGNRRRAGAATACSWMRRRPLR